jgi:hypothetical protein
MVQKRRERKGASKILSGENNKNSALIRHFGIEIAQEEVLHQKQLTAG